MEYDVIVCGAGPSGIAAAVSCKRDNKKVLLIEASGLLGGANVLSLVGPLMTFHNHKGRIIGGFGQEIIDRLCDKNYSYGHCPDPVGFCVTVTPVAVEGLKEVYFDLIEEEGIDLLLHATVCGIEKSENQITALQVATKSGLITAKAQVYIDATGDGDIAAFSGCPYVCGRPGDNMTQPMTMLFAVAGVDFSRLRAYHKNHPADFYKGNTDTKGYFGLSGFFRKVEAARQDGNFNIPRDRVLLFENVGTAEVTVNITRVLNYSGSDPRSLTQAELAGRRQTKEAFAFLKKYIPGFENSYIARTPYQIGVRETRHILGEYLLKKEDIVSERGFADAIALSAFPIDIHSPDGRGLDAAEQTGTYEIPLRVMLPQGIDNLIVTGRCVSATHEASASLRVTPTVMALGQAAGVLAARSVHTDIIPRAVKYREIAEILKEKGAVLKKEDI